MAAKFSSIKEFFELPISKEAEKKLNTNNLIAI